MAYDALKRPAFTTDARDRRYAIDALDAVTLAAAAQTDDGETVPAGTVGTVVAVWGQAEAFDIEFDAPYTGLVTIGRDMIRAHERSG